jgi:calcium-translocating P-type ATPase
MRGPVAGTVIDTAVEPGEALRGLSTRDASERLLHDGPNRLPEPPGVSPVRLLVAQMTHFFALMLWSAAGLALVAGMPVLAVAIVVVVLLNGAFSFAQEYRADRAAERLRSLLPMRVAVRRDGRRQVVDAVDLVVGDVVLLAGGDRVCADLSLVEAHELRLDESMLTGESKLTRAVAGGSAWAGTFAVEGEAVALVVATGGGTRLAEIANLTETAHPPVSPLAHQLHRVVRIVASIAIAVGVAFFGIALLLGSPPSDGFLFAVGVTVALVPEGLLPTVTLALALASQRMAKRHALVRRLEAVETLGSTTFICTDKTGTITRNQMTAVEVWTPYGTARVFGSGYERYGHIDGPVDVVRSLARTALLCSSGRLQYRAGAWVPVGDPMDVALHVLAFRAGEDADPADGPDPVTRRYPFDPRRRMSSVVAGDVLHVKGAPDAVLPRCAAGAGADEALHRLTGRGLRVLAIAERRGPVPQGSADDVERDLELLGLVGLEDPPRPGVAEAITACRRAGIRIALLTGDHPGTARTIAAEVGIIGPDGPVLEGRDLPSDTTDLGILLDRDVVVARVTPEDKLRIAEALQARGHVVAMTGDGVNDGPALRAADVGVAMGASGTDVAREAADLVLLDDRFETIVAAVELGRATFSNIRRFLTYHLTDNVAELTPFVVWALSGGRIPLALTVLQVLALDIGTDLLPALALGAEPPNEHVLEGRVRTTSLIDRTLIGRVFGVLGPTEAVAEMLAFASVLLAGGWAWGDVPSDHLLGVASGAAFASVVLGQLANAFACRSQRRWALGQPLTTNPLLLGAVSVELAVLFLFLALPPLPHLLGGAWPSLLGWALAAMAVPFVLAADALHKAVLNRDVVSPPSARCSIPVRAENHGGREGVNS